MKFVLIAMSICFLYIVYNFEMFSTVDSSMASKMAAKMEETLYLLVIAVFFPKRSSHFCYYAFQHHFDCIML